MTKEVGTLHNPGITRIESIDVLRGLTIMLMIFVNDVAGIRSAPSWLKHVSASTDGMTIPDIVFPAFLFVMGMSIPVAMARRLESGQHWLRIASHVLFRSVSLMFIGILTLNRPDDALIGWPRGMWQFLMYASVFAVWHHVSAPEGGKQRISRIVRIAGIVCLAALVVSFKGRDGQWLQRGWWGILGLIGWAYLIAVGIYAVTKDNRSSLIGEMCLLLSFFIAYHEGKFGRLWLNGSTLGSHPSITVAGVITGTLILPGFSGHTERIRWALVFAAFLFAAGWLLRPLYGVNKIVATPSWCLWCSAITGAAWAALYWLIDVKGWNRIFRICKNVGTNALFAYLLAPLVYMLFRIAGIKYFALGNDALVIGLSRTILFTLFITLVSGRAGLMGFRLKL